jgi:outer membrane protein assembly factor BamB
MNTDPGSAHLKSKLLRRPILTALLPAVVLIAAACSSGSPSSQPSQSSAAAEWPHANHDFANTRVASGSSISSSNVNQLGVDWTFGVSGASAYGSLATSPIVVGGTVYLQDLKSNVYAIDLRTGKLEWQKLFDAENVGPNGPAFDNGTLFVTSDMHTVGALDAKTGEEVWSKRIAPPATQGITQQLTARAGTVYMSTVPGGSLASFYARR